MDRKTVECEKCGCRDTSLVDTYLGESTYQCNHCGYKTIDGLSPFEEVSAEYQTTICPFCESSNNKVVRGPQQDKSGRFKRFHKCGNCRNTFPSYEEEKKKPKMNGFSAERAT